jgi:putative phosphoribosyl transferase
MFRNREAAAIELVEKIKQEIGDFFPSQVLILSIPRGGVLVGKKMALSIGCGHDVLVVEKLIAGNGVCFGATVKNLGGTYVDENIAKDLGLDEQDLRRIVDGMKEVVRQKEIRYGKKMNSEEYGDKCVIIVDDGVVTGASMIAAAREIWERNPLKLMIASPVINFKAYHKLEKEVDCVIACQVEKLFYSIEQFYKEFPKISEEEVRLYI